MILSLTLHLISIFDNHIIIIIMYEEKIIQSYDVVFISLNVFHTKSAFALFIFFVTQKREKKEKRTKRKNKTKQNG